MTALGALPDHRAESMRAIGAALLFYLVVVCLRFAPLLGQLEEALPGLGPDPPLNTWIMAWASHALWQHPARLFEANAFYPAEHALAFSDHLLGVVPLFAPALLITGNPVAAYNVIFLLSYVLCGVAAYLLARAWTRSPWAALVAGTLFAVAPYRLAQYGHLQLLNFFWAPLALLALERFLRDRSWSALSLFALCYWLQVLSSFYLGWMMTAAVVVYVVCHLALTRLRVEGFAGKTFAFVAASALIMLPLHLPYLAVHRAWQASRSLQEVAAYAPLAIDYTTPSAYLHPVYVAVLPLHRIGSAPETTLFPGLVLPTLVLLGAWGPIEGMSTGTLRRLRWLFGSLLVVGLVLSLGPSVAVGPVRIPLPYLALYHLLPGWDAMRVPTRFMLLALLAAVPLAAAGVLRCSQAVAGWRWIRGGALPATAIALIAGALLEIAGRPFDVQAAQWTGEDRRPYEWLLRARGGPLAEIPIDPRADYRPVFLSIAHWLPLVNGWSGFLPPTYFEIRERLAALPARQDVDYAGQLGVRTLVVHHDRLDEEARWRWASADPEGAGLVPLARFGAATVYGVPPVETTAAALATRAPLYPVPAGTTLLLPLEVTAGATAWRHPGPQGLQPVLLQWHGPGHDAIAPTPARVRLPLVVPPHTTATAAVHCTTPSEPGRYELRLLWRGSPLMASPEGVVDVVARPFATSRDSPRRLAAHYELDGEPSRVMAPWSTIVVDVRAYNTGTATWLAAGPEGHGSVRLGWRWVTPSGGTLPGAGRALMDHDVLPGGAHRFRALVETPAPPGSYTLELGLLSEWVMGFAVVGTPPVRIHVDVRSRS